MVNLYYGIAGSDFHNNWAKHGYHSEGNEVLFRNSLLIAAIED